jgi:hypothetical protein
MRSSDSRLASSSDVVTSGFGELSGILEAGSGSLFSHPGYCHWLLFARSTLATFQRDLCPSPCNSGISPSLDGTGPSLQPVRQTFRSRIRNTQDEISHRFRKPRNRLHRAHCV